MIAVHFSRLDSRAVVPTYAHPSDAGADLACLEDIELKPGQRKLIRTGLAVAIPDGFVGLVHPRSGLAHKNGISIVNTPGTIDSGYRGEILINLINLDSTEIFTAPAGSRIAQLLIQKYETANFIEVDSLGESDRADRGFGSTGLQSL